MNITGLGGVRAVKKRSCKTYKLGLGNPCWSGYEQFGMKNKAGRSVPNCVKIKK